MTKTPSKTAQSLTAKAGRLNLTGTPIGEHPPAEHAPAEAAPAPARLSAPVVRVRPVRVSLDLPPAEFSAVKLAVAEAGDRLGVRVTTRDVARALLHLWATDPDLRHRIDHHITNTK